MTSTTDALDPSSNLTNLRVALLELALRYPTAMMRVPDAQNEAFPVRNTALDDVTAYEAMVRAVAATSPSNNPPEGTTVDELEAQRIAVEALPIDGTDKDLSGWDLAYRVEVLANIAYADPNETDEHRSAAVLELLRSVMALASTDDRATLITEWTA